VAGLTLQIFEVPAKIVLDEFLVDAQIKAVGHLDDSLNNEEYDYLNISEVVATPWRQDNPVRPIAYSSGVLRIQDIFMVYPIKPEAQESIKRLPRYEPVIFYLRHFAVHANLNMGTEMSLPGVMDSIPRRFLIVTDVSVFPMFPASAALPELMPLALLNRALVSHYHAAEG
jgi:hypothetical protein